MKHYFIFYVLPLGSTFFNSSQNGTCILMGEHKRTNLLYIIYNMGFKDKWAKSFNCSLVAIITYKHSRRAKSKGKLHCFWRVEKTWTPLISSSSALKIIKIELRKLWPLKINGSITQKTNHQCYKGQFPNTHKIPCMLFCCC